MDPDKLLDQILALYNHDGEPSPLLSKCLTHLRDRIREVALSLNSGEKIPRQDVSAHTLEDPQRKVYVWEVSLKGMIHPGLQSNLSHEAKARLVTPTMAKAGFHAGVLPGWDHRFAAVVHADLLFLHDPGRVPVLKVELMLQHAHGPFVTALHSDAGLLPREAAYELADGALFTVKGGASGHRVFTLEPANLRFVTLSDRVEAAVLGVHRWHLGAGDPAGMAVLEAVSSPKVDAAWVVQLISRLGVQSFRGEHFSLEPSPQWEEKWGHTRDKALVKLELALMSSKADLPSGKWFPLCSKGCWTLRQYVRPSPTDLSLWTGPLRGNLFHMMLTDERATVLAAFTPDCNLLDSPAVEDACLDWVDLAERGTAKVRRRIDIGWPSSRGRYE
jgi:hypothetical protein